MKYLISLITLLPLILAAIIYTAFRGDCCFASQFLSGVLGESLANNYVAYMQTNFQFSETNIYSLPGGLWVFSTAFLSSRITMKRKNVAQFLVFLPLLYSFFLEGLQFYALTDGTFDRFDLLYSSLAWVAAILVSKTLDLSTKTYNLSSSVIVLFYAILFLANGI